MVHIRRREVVVYPDDTTKPPQGYGLNRKAEITLDGVWPTDKSTREFIRSPERLAAIRFDERLEKATHKMDASYVSIFRLTLPLTGLSNTVRTRDHGCLK